jgi:hypothetical protein
MLEYFTSPCGVQFPLNLLTPRCSVWPSPGQRRRPWCAPVAAGSPSQGEAQKPISSLGLCVCFVAYPEPPCLPCSWCRNSSVRCWLLHTRLRSRFQWTPLTWITNGVEGREDMDINKLTNKQKNVKRKRLSGHSQLKLTSERGIMLSIFKISFNTLVIDQTLVFVVGLEHVTWRSRKGFLLTNVYRYSADIGDQTKILRPP